MVSCTDTDYSIAMIIPNKLIKLEYDPTKDILFVEWPDFTYYAIPELHHILDNIIETIRHYDINFLMLDARSTAVTISQEDYDSIAQKFARNLMKTRIKKVARLITDDPGREKQVKELKEGIRLAVDIKSFSTVDEALAWFKL